MISYNKQQLNKIRSLLVVFNKTVKSGVIFIEAKGDVIISIPSQKIDISDKDLLKWGKKNYNIDFESIPNKKELIKEFRKLKAVELIGGLGVSSRNLNTIEEILPGIKERIERENGKIVFIGNGLSDACVDIDKKCIIVDLFDYPKLKDDLERLKDFFKDNGLKFTLKEKLKNLIKILDNSGLFGKIKIVKYFFSSGKVSRELKNADLVINCFGPSHKTINEQLSMLSIGGELYATLKKDLVKKEVDKNRFVIKDIGNDSIIIKRIK